MADNQVASSSKPHTSGLLAGAQGVIINNSTMNEVHQHLGPSVLERMLPHIIPGTDFDSSSRDDPPRCHPDTRTNFLEQLQAHIHDTSLGTRLVWLVGPAGVGKSAIMQSLAEVVCPLPTLRCATLFFSRPNNRDDPKKAFATLAYSLVVNDPDYRLYMEAKLATDPNFLHKSLDEQFKHLFITPFTSGYVRVGSRRWVMFLDGFDEINGERDQCRILDLIRNSLPPIPIKPFIWIIASRPEAHLQASFRRVNEQVVGFSRLEVPMDSVDALRSVELYLRTEFSKIRHDYSDVVPPLWPSENDFLQLTKASSGLFIFASTLVDYVGKENPVLRLKHIVSLINQNTAHCRDASHQAKNPFRALDVLYTAIMSNVPPDALSTTKSILAFYLLGNTIQVTTQTSSLLFLCNILGLEQHAAYVALRKLHSVLAFPLPDQAHQEAVRFLHASFSDFLKDQSRSQSYYIDLNQELLKLWRRYGNFVKLAPVEGLSGRITLSWEPPSRTADLCDLIQIHAQDSWLRILFHCNHDPSCQCTEIQHRLLLDTCETIEVFREFSVERYESLWLQSPKGNIAAFCDWLSDHVPVTLRQELIFKSCDLTLLSEDDTENMFRGLDTRKRGFYHLQMVKSGHASWIPAEFNLKDLSVDQWNQAKERALYQRKCLFWGSPPLRWDILANLLRRRHNLYCTAKVIIIPKQSARERCAIIGPLHIAVSNDSYLEYLVLPYVEE